MSIKLKTVDIVCPLYNAEDYVEKLHASFLQQEGVALNQIRYVVTKGTDRTEEIVRGLADVAPGKTIFRVILASQFSHSKTREEEAFASKADVVVFVTQDVKIKRKDWLFRLVVPILDGEVEATYSRQVCKNESIEKYTRELNYPLKSRIVSKDDLNELGLKTFFFSDASSAVLRSKFVALKGYDGKKLPISEDMYFAHKLIMGGGRVKYCADSVVEHSHNFSLREIYRRYRLTGEFMKMNPKIAKTGTTKAGGGLAKYVLKRAWQEKNWSVLANFLPNMGARWLGMKAGER